MIFLHLLCDWIRDFSETLGPNLLDLTNGLIPDPTNILRGTVRGDGGKSLSSRGGVTEMQKQGMRDKTEEARR